MPSSMGAIRYVLLSLGVGVFGIIISFILVQSGAGGFFAIFAGVFALVGCVLGVLFWKYGYIFVPWITQRSNVIVMAAEETEIPPTQDVIVKKSDNVYYATSFLGLKIYESATEKSLEENIVFSQYFERAISDLKFVTKISYLLYVEDIAEERKKIEGKRAEAQLKLSRERDKPQPDPLKIDRYERELAHWDLQLTKLIKGIKPMGIIAYAQTTAVGTSKDAAIASVREQAKTLKTILANSLNVEVVVLTADEMFKCFEWERFFPVSPEELEASVA